MKIPNIIKDVVIFALIFGGVLYGLPKAMSFILKTPYPMAAISSNSMWPVLQKGDLVLTQGAEKEDIRVGDIVVYKLENGGFIIHRVIKLKKEELITKGDANQVADAPVEYEKVVGKALNINGKPFKIPLLGNITAFAN